MKLPPNSFIEPKPAGGRAYIQSLASDEAWKRARDIVGSFDPIIQLIRQICQTTIGQPSRINMLVEGAVLPLKKVVIASARDKILGGGAAVSEDLSLRQALEIVPSDVVAASLVLHSVGRKLKSQPLERVWGTFLDEALTRAVMGFFVGQVAEGFGAGRAMLAGFSSRAGLALLVAQGTESQAGLLLKGLASGGSIEDVCLDVYRANPVDVGALLVLAAGCGTEACMGLRNCAGGNQEPPEDPTALLWWAAHTLVDMTSVQTLDLIPPSVWDPLGFVDPLDRQDLYELVKVICRKGNLWRWLLD